MFGWSVKFPGENSEENPSANISGFTPLY